MVDEDVLFLVEIVEELAVDELACPTLEWNDTNDVLLNMPHEVLVLLLGASRQVELDDLAEVEMLEYMRRCRVCGRQSCAGELQGMNAIGWKIVHSSCE